MGLLKHFIGVNLVIDNFSIVLNSPKIPENIGAAARAAWNMGIKELIVVAPENLESERMLKMATHNAAHLIKNMQIYSNLKEAVAKFNYIVGTSARTGRGRRATSPRELAPLLISKASSNRIALIFGPEDKGLTTEEIRLCHQLVKIPTAEFSSLNLAQAVMIMAYEVFLATLNENFKLTPTLANSQQLELMYEKVKEVLIKINFIHPGNPDHWMMNVRRFFSRISLTTNEVNLIMGICRQVEWYGRGKRENGRGGEK
ncbi:MAG: RNA methyltransferase [Desulfobacterota bacterium]|nr:RNA methyltransferase [Thermodesulfobacteriota bacterium]